MTAKHRILLVDDYVDVVDVLSVLLTMRGHECRGATTGRAALDEAARFEPDIVILDLELRDLSGFELATALRKRHPNTRHIAALTGWTGHRARAEARGSGIDQFVLKPGNVEQLIRRAESSLQSAA